MPGCANGGRKQRPKCDSAWPRLWNSLTRNVLDLMRPHGDRTGGPRPAPMSPQPGEVWLADLGLAAKNAADRDRISSRSQPASRPHLIRASHDLYVPLTTQNRLSPYEVALPRFPFLDRDSVANVQGLGSLPAVRLERKLGRLSKEAMTALKAALAFALDLDSLPSSVNGPRRGAVSASRTHFDV